MKDISITDSYFHLARKYFAQHNYENCIAYCKIVIRQKSKYWYSAYFLTGQCYIQLEDFDNAINSFHMIKQSVQSGLSYLALACLYKSEYRKAINHYKKVLTWVSRESHYHKIDSDSLLGIDIAPDNLERLANLSVIAHNNSGCAFYHLNQNTKAVYHLKESLKSSAHYPTVINNLAIVLMAENCLEEAHGLLATHTKLHKRSSSTPVTTMDLASIILPFHFKHPTGILQKEKRLSQQLLGDLEELLKEEKKENY